MKVVARTWYGGARGYIRAILIGMIHHFNEAARTCPAALDGHRPARVRPFLPAGALILAMAGGTASLAQGDQGALRHLDPICLAISPLRAIPALAGRRDSLGPEGWRDAVVRSLRQFRNDSSWLFRPAGECPESVATIDVFQFPTDVVASAQSQALRMRMEWRHVPGQSEFFLSSTEKRPLDPSAVASQLLVVAEQQMAQLELTSLPPGATVKLLSGDDWRSVGPSPRSILVPPGAVSVTFDAQGRQRRIDTLVDAGKNYLVLADFRASRIDPQVRWEPRRTWPLWSLTLISLGGGLLATREQLLAQRAYDRLGSGDAPAAFSESWSRLRTANLLRNGLFSAAFVFGAGAGWMEWSTRTVR